MSIGPWKFLRRAATVFSLLIFGIVAGAQNDSSEMTKTELPIETTKEAAPAHSSIQVLHASGKNLAAVLALSCSEGAWQNFNQWTQTSGFWNASFKDTYNLTPTRTSLKLQGEGIEQTAEVKVSQLRLSSTFDGQNQSSDEPCTLITSQLKDVTMLDDKAALFVTATTLAGVSLLDAKRAPMNLPAVATTLLFGLNPEKRGVIEIDLSRFLDSGFAIKCSDAVTTLQTGAHKVVLHRSKNAKTTIELFDKETDIAVTLDKFSEFTTRSRDYLAEITRTCKKTKDAESMQQLATDTIDAARQHVTELKIPVTPTAESERQPASKPEK